MSFAALLTHRVAIVSARETGAEDEYGRPVTIPHTVVDVAAAIQPKTAREMAAISEAGAALGDWTIYTLPRAINAGEHIVHDSSDCPVPESADIPDARFELVGVRNAAGLGHHLELDAKLVGPIAGVAGS